MDPILQYLKEKVTAATVDNVVAEDFAGAVAKYKNPEGFESEAYYQKNIKHTIDYGGHKWDSFYLTVCAGIGNFEGVRYCVEALNATIDQKNKNRHTALGVAVAYGHLRTVKYLLAKEADIESSGDQALRPLTLSSYAATPINYKWLGFTGKSQAVCAILLLLAGADATSTAEYPIQGSFRTGDFIKMAQDFSEDCFRQREYRLAMYHKLAILFSTAEKNKISAEKLASTHGYKIDDLYNELSDSLEIIDKLFSLYQGEPIPEQLQLVAYTLYQRFPEKCSHKSWSTPFKNPLDPIHIDQAIDALNCVKLADAVKKIDAPCKEGKLIAYFPDAKPIDPG